MHAPTIRYMKIEKRVLRYLEITADIGNMYPRRVLVTARSIVAAVDVDWGGEKDIRRSTTGPRQRIDDILQLNKADSDSTIIWRG